MSPLAPRVILLDDDADFLALERKIFESGGYEVSSFSDPKAAIAALSESRQTLIVCDLMMTALDSGFSFAKKVKGDPRFRRVPIIIVSAIGSQKGFDFHPRTAEDLAAMNADAFFDKPVQPQALLAKAQELLSSAEEPHS
jgi:CheY-like chemotaxis protein